MAQITAALVKELRERTGSGMMECKKALVETDGDLEAAVEHLRKTGAAKADKKAGRLATEGTLAVAGGGTAMVMVEINCETDFVGRQDEFQDFARGVAEVALAARPADLAALMAVPMADGSTVEEARIVLIAKVGENITVRRFNLLEVDAGHLASYLHGNRIGVMVALSGGDEELGRDIAMHIAASSPVCISADEVPQELLDRERGIYAAQAAESGKPANIVEKMVEGRMRKYLNEVTLLGQPFVKDPDQSVEKVLKAAGAQVLRFQRFELGEGIEKKAENFAEEVMAQARGG